MAEGGSGGYGQWLWMAVATATCLWVTVMAVGQRLWYRDYRYPPKGIDAGQMAARPGAGGLMVDEDGFGRR